ncbi:Dual-specificity kinase, spindle pole body (SPB) duplication and spindle checkpoint function [Puccinia graminis f. sp. tritici]|uniref:Dual-specificity kinase, spindle pole body (SPB) duplication and spindle checkpoint function n=1 Tax=Puccinia graminis f. sp. tritici TaxID=56615 RepID=A0A5B0QZZ1_PUCGR|nr:Dual-specificity kinase, spindle pole body (SPB) duplication and spindle checkpoint function [Puccinia graminis f. sp. tritici]
MSPTTSQSSAHHVLSPSSASRSSFSHNNPFRPRRSTSAASLQRPFQSASGPPSHPPAHSNPAPAIKRLGSKLFHRRPSLSLSSSSTGQLTTATSLSPPTSERPLSSQPDSNPHARQPNYPQLISRQPNNNQSHESCHSTGHSARRSSISLRSSILGITNLSTKSLSSLSRIGNLNRSNKHSSSAMDDDQEYYQTLSQPSTPSMKGQYISQAASNLIQTPATPVTPLEKPEFQTEYARQLFRGTTDHRSYHTHEDEDEELAAASSGSDFEAEHRRHGLTSGTVASRGSTSSLSRANNANTNLTDGSHECTSEHSHQSPHLAPRQMLPKSRSSVLFAHPRPNSPTYQPYPSSSHTPAVSSVLNSRAPRPNSNFRSSVRRKVDGLKVGITKLRPSRIPVDEANCLASEEASSTSGKDYMNSIGSNETARSQRALSIASYRAGNAVKDPSSQVSPGSSNPSMPSLPVRSPAGDTPGLDGLHQPTSATRSSQSSALNSQNAHPRSMSRHSQHQSGSIGTRENEAVVSGRPGSINGSIHSQICPPGSQRLRPGRVPFQSLDLPSDSYCQITSPTQPGSQPPSRSSHCPSGSLDVKKSPIEALNAADPEPTLEVGPNPEGGPPAPPPSSFARRRSPIIHESSNDLRRQIAREVNGQGPFVAQRAYSDTRLPQSSVTPSTSRAIAGGTFNQSRNSIHRQLSVREPDLKSTSTSNQHPHQSASSYHQQQQHYLQPQNLHSNQKTPQWPHNHLYSSAQPANGHQQDYLHPGIPATPCNNSQQPAHRYETPSLNHQCSLSALSTAVPQRQRQERRPPPPVHSPSQDEDGDSDDDDDDDQIVCQPRPASRTHSQLPASEKRFYVHEDQDGYNNNNNNNNNNHHHHQRQVPLNDERNWQTRKPVGHNRIDRNLIIVNGIEYSRQCVIGRGGSSKVFRAGMTDGSPKMVAIKVVGLKQADEQTYQTFCNEIALLERLKGHDRIINLIDSSMDNLQRKVWLVMELGETDLNQLLNRQMGKPISFRFIKHIWEQMLEAVQAVHNQDIIHTDLKPANFVLVQGSVKIIDFGIAKAVPADTANISRETQIGTANYMSPEALMMQQSSHGDHQTVKMGRPTDVWALGCILYQMIYGHTPFSKLDTTLKVHTIRDPGHKIEYPESVVPMRINSEGKKVAVEEYQVTVERAAINTIKACLTYHKDLRPTIPELLKDEFLLGSLAATPPSKINPDGAMTLRPGMFELVIQKSWDWYARKTANGGRLTENQKKKFLHSLKMSVKCSQ